MSEEDTHKAITIPLETIQPPRRFEADLVEFLVRETEGYPYFVQYLADMAFNTFDHSPILRSDFEKVLPEIYARLDESFFSGRLYPLTPKERAITLATSRIAAPFTPTNVLDIVKSMGGEVTMGTVQQYLLTLQSKNIIFKVRRGAYQYALPLFGKFLTRCMEQEDRS